MMENQRDYYQPNFFTRLAKAFGWTVLCFAIPGVPLYGISQVSNWPTGTGVAEVLMSAAFLLGGITLIFGVSSYSYGCRRNWKK